MIAEHLSKEHLISSEQVTTRARVVKLLKLLCVGIALTLGLILCIMPYLNPLEHIILNVYEVSEKYITKPRMLNPHLQGVDKEGRPYNITADVAIQDETDLLSLKNIHADIAEGHQGWYVLMSERAKFLVKKKHLELIGGVNIFSDQGQEMRTINMHINLHTGEADGPNPVTMQGPMGTLEAQRFAVRDRGNRFIFYDRPRLVIYPK